jgi:hypothetical protein
MVIDYMWAASDMAVVDTARRLSIPKLVAARQQLADRPAWTVIFAKAFALVAVEIPELRRAYLKWPWPHFHEYAESTITIIVGHEIEGDGALLPVRIRAPDAFAIMDINATLRRDSADPLGSRFIRGLVTISRYPAFIRRPIWWLCINVPRLRRHTFGTSGVSSVASMQASLGASRSPAPFLLKYGPFDPDGSLEARLAYDHRVIDGALAARALARLEEILNSALLAEMR